ncbi:YigZ family protein [uncultured Porphyromonas sp.]|uniref:IMPACT family protein n=1 Tax=uncultured Porphyromonas sp. TaxID=159274 RepID=UPI002618D371|nr:YigZ family protein [uncultured Porphyromonas sp.]
MAEEVLFASYTTLRGRSEAIYTEQRSKFIAFAIPVDSEAAAMEEVQNFRKRYYDARHVCWAYRIGKEVPVERLNDDGEPSSTAGKPILGQMLSYGLTDLLIVVVRYFGGVKLGTSGLIVAYRTAAEEAIKAGDMVEVTLYSHYRLFFPFDLINPVMILLRQYEAETLLSDADLEGHIWEVKVPNSRAKEFEEALTVLYQLKAKRLAN